MRLRPLAALTFALMAAPALTSAAPRPAPLTIAHAWARPAMAGRTAAGYLIITNTGKAADTLLSAASPAATRVSLHQMQMSGGVMRMRALSSLQIAPGASVTLAPGGLHLMLEGLKQELKIGDHVPAVLTFARAGPMRVELSVQATPSQNAHDHAM